MKASHFPREYKIFNLETGKFFTDNELAQNKLTISYDGLPFWNANPSNVIVVWFSGQKDIKGTKLYEGDTVKMNVKNEFGSYQERLGIMRWSEQSHQFILGFVADFKGVFEVIVIEKLGHELTHPDLLS